MLAWLSTKEVTDGWTTYYACYSCLLWPIIEAC